MNKKQFPWRIFLRIVILQVSLVSFAVLSSGLAARYFYKKSFEKQAEAQLKDTLLLLSHALITAPSKEWCKTHLHETTTRLSVWTVSEKKLCDSSKVNDFELGSRKEVKSIQNQLVDKTFKFTAENEMGYGVLYLAGPELFLHASLSLERLSFAMKAFDTSLGVFSLIVIVGLALIAVWFSKMLVLPVTRLLVKTQGLLGQSTEQVGAGKETYGEWSVLESNIEGIRKNIENTSHKLTLEQLEIDTLMGAISDAILAVDPEGSPLFYNTRFEMIFKRGGVSGDMKVWEIFKNEPDILKGFTKALKDGKTWASRALPIEIEGGDSKMYFVLSVSPLIKQVGTIYGALGIFHDVTELKSAEQMRIDFVANVSHELRTPLTSIKGYTETLIEDANKNPELLKSSSSKEYLEIIHRNANRLMNLMADLLDLSSLESTEVLHKENTSVSEITNKVVKQLEDRIKEKNQTLDAGYECSVVYADPGRLEQVLVNLLDNAHKYTPKGGKITLTWIQKAQDVILKVQDTGPGIPRESQPRLFERFYRVDKARSREQGGTGLGLSIVKHIMQRHEGAIWVESEQGLGSTFLCRFPMLSKTQV